jgi:RNA polymerase-binding protein DksA
MKKAELQQFRQILVQLRSRLQGDVSQLANEALAKRDSGSLSSMPIHMADIGSENYDQEFTLSLLQNEQQGLHEVDEAIKRVDKGSFGQCAECASEISRERLKHIPYTRYCVSCARKLEQSA